MYFVYSFYLAVFYIFINFATTKHKPKKMKNKVLKTMFLMMMLGINVCMAHTTNEQIVLQVCGSDDPFHHGKHHGREMQRHLQVYLEGNKLSFDETGQSFTLYLYSGNAPVYYQDVQGDVNQVELPANLKGEFCLMLVYDDIAYSGEITLN